MTRYVFSSDSRCSAFSVGFSIIAAGLVGCGLFGADFSEPPSRPGGALGADGGDEARERSPGNLPAGAPGTCGAGQKSCNGTCVSIADPLYGCTDTMCVPCSVAGGAAACHGKVCKLASCSAPKADCDSSVGTGCETNTQTSAAHCGACGQACAAGKVCSAGSCKAECDANLAQCGSSCIDPSTDAAHCNACNNACPPPVDGSATCSAGSCGIQCNAGYRVCAGNTCKAENAQACGSNCVVCPGPSIGAGTSACINHVCKVQCDAGYSLCASGCCKAGGLQPVLWKQVSAGVNHTCAVTRSGAAKCWGSNSYDQLGTGTGGPSINTAPLAVQGLDFGVAMIAAGNGHTCALMLAGGVRCWGVGDSGQLGFGDALGSRIPKNVPAAPPGTSLLYAGSDRSCAITGTGSVRCWGVSVKLGGERVLAPREIEGLSTPISAISLGVQHQCALTAVGGIKCWGYDFYGELGAGSVNSSDVPVDVQGLNSGIAMVAVGARHSCAVSKAGALKCWGQNAHGQLGTGSKAEVNAVPVDVMGLGSGVSMVALGEYHSCALMKTGGVKCWGRNPSGQIGDGDSAPSVRSMPVDVRGLDGPVAMIASGDGHTCAVGEAGALQCWGYNGYGQLGNRTYINSEAPVYVTSF
jgi:alpha-tubulin suppressor-like RCC1 family protein